MSATGRKRTLSQRPEGNNFGLDAIGGEMMTKEKVTSWALVAAAIAALLWPAYASYITASFLLITFGMLAIDRPRGELFKAPDAEAPTSHTLYWQLQPRWVKAFALWIGFPAWLLLMGQMGAEPPYKAEPVLLGAFAATAVLEIVFIARAYWRMEI